jgi:hypothetical protein
VCQVSAERRNLIAHVAATIGAVGARPTISDAQRRARLAVRHCLADRARTDDVPAIADAVVALHSTDPATVYLSAMARMKHPSVDPVSTALYDDRTVVRHHAMRRTLWVFTPQVAKWAHAACTTGLAAAQWQRLVQLVEDSGVATDGAAWVAAARRDALAAVHRLGSSTARQLGREVPALTEKLVLAPGKPYGGTQGAHTRLLYNLGMDGLLVRGRPSGGWTNSEYPWALMSDWLGEPITGVDPATGAAALARRYLDRFGPATLADLQWWAGWTTGVTRRALGAIGAEEVDLESGDTGWVLPGDVRSPVVAPWIAFLPALDSTTMGWKERTWYLAEHGTFGHSVFDRNGNAGPTIWMDGEVVGGWVQRTSGEIAYRLLVDVARARQKQIAAAAERLSELIGPARVNVRFPAPIQKELLA